MDYEFRFCTLDDFVFGIAFCNCYCKDKDTGQEDLVGRLQIGLLIATLNFYFEPIE